MKKVFGIILKVYAVFSMCAVTILIIAALIILINFNKITSFAVEKAVNSFNTELNDLVSGFFSAAEIDNSIRFESIKTIQGGGLQASFIIDSAKMPDLNLIGYHNKTNEQIISDLGIIPDDIPGEVKTLLKMTKQKLVLDFKDTRGIPIIQREISAKEIEELLR